MLSEREALEVACLTQLIQDARAEAAWFRGAAQNCASASGLSVTPHNQTAPSNSTLLACILPVVASGRFVYAFMLGITDSAAGNLVVTLKAGTDVAMSVASGGTAIGTSCYIASGDTPGIQFSAALSTILYSDIIAMAAGSPSDITTISGINDPAFARGTRVAFAVQVSAAGQNLSGISGNIGVFELP